MILVRFTDKYVRNQVFHLSRKYKEKFTGTVRDDMIQPDYTVWMLAKPQMSSAYERGKKSRCRYGKLVVDSKQIPVDGVISNAQIIAKAADEARLIRRTFTRLT